MVLMISSTWMTLESTLSSYFSPEPSSCRTAPLGPASPESLFPHTDHIYFTASFSEWHDCPSSCSGAWHYSVSDQSPCFFFLFSPWSLSYSSPCYCSLFFFNLLVSFFQNLSLQSITYTNAWLIYLKKSFIDSGMNSWNNNLLSMKCVIFLFSSLKLHPFLCTANRIKVTLPSLACKLLTIQPHAAFLVLSLTIPRSQSLLFELVSGSA